MDYFERKEQAQQQAARLWQSIQDMPPEQAKAVIADALFQRWQADLMSLAQWKSEQVWRFTEFPNPLDQGEQVGVLRRALMQDVRMSVD